MGPIRLSYAERAALRKLIRHGGNCEHRHLKPRHAERLIELGFVMRRPMRYHLTTRGQVEVLRQRYSGLRARAEAAAQKDEDAFLFIQSHSF